MYNILTENLEALKRLTAAGVVDPHWLRDVEMYRDFSALDTTCIMCKYSAIAAKYGINEESVRKRIKAMERVG